MVTIRGWGVFLNYINLAGARRVFTSSQTPAAGKRCFWIQKQTAKQAEVLPWVITVPQHWGNIGVILGYYILLGFRGKGVRSLGLGISVQDLGC